MCACRRSFEAASVVVEERVVAACLRMRSLTGTA